jgi:hypothetical protein
MMACRGCGRRRGSSVQGSKKMSVFGPGHEVRLRYLGDSKELLDFAGPATRKLYTVGGRLNLISADSRDLSTGISWAPGLLELTDSAGAKLFEFHRPLKKEIEAERKAREMEKKAWEAAEALALPPEEPKPKRRKAKVRADDTDSISTD